MDQYSLFALAAIILACLRYGTYFHTIYKGETKPHAFSWLLWGVITGIAASAQFSLEGGPSSWALAFVALTCLLVSFIGFMGGSYSLFFSYPHLASYR